MFIIGCMGLSWRELFYFVMWCVSILGMLFVGMFIIYVIYWFI